VEGKGRRFEREEREGTTGLQLKQRDVFAEEPTGVRKKKRLSGKKGRPLDVERPAARGGGEGKDLLGKDAHFIGRKKQRRFGQWKKGKGRDRVVLIFRYERRRKEKKERKRFASSLCEGGEKYENRFEGKGKKKGKARISWL